jgi:S1-C subfamily serine protease
MGFVNIDMHLFGVQMPELKAIARQPDLPTSLTKIPVTSTTETRSREVVSWAGAKVRNMVGPDEVSASGTPGEAGVIVLEAPEDGLAGKAGFLSGDVILAFDGKAVKELQDLMQGTQNETAGKPSEVTILRFQQESTLRITIK